MITQCDMRHLYDAKPKNETLILQAKEYERRRCRHHELEEPLSTLECLSSVVDPKGSGSNKHRYVVASNEKEVRAKMRSIPGVPLIYISKSVVLMEPMTSATEDFREREEKSKFKQGLKGARKPDVGEKRKREDEEEKDDKSIATEAQVPKKRRQKGPKQPNPLSMKKKKTDTPKTQPGSEKTAKPAEPKESQAATAVVPDGETAAPKKRRRKHKSKAEGGAAEGGGISLETGDASP